VNKLYIIVDNSFVSIVLDLLLTRWNSACCWNRLFQTCFLQLLMLMLCWRLSFVWQVNT